MKNLQNFVIYIVQILLLTVCYHLLTCIKPINKNNKNNRNDKNNQENENYKNNKNNKNCKNNRDDKKNNFNGLSFIRKFIIGYVKKDNKLFFLSSLLF